MTDAGLFNAMRFGAALLTVLSMCIATAVNLPDLGLSKQSIALLSVVQAGITGALLFLPAVQKHAGNLRGDSRDNDHTPPADGAGSSRTVSG